MRQDDCGFEAMTGAVSERCHSRTSLCSRPSHRWGGSGRELLARGVAQTDPTG